jgi:RNA polymerase sigma factor (sigma-70 family)
MKRWHGFRHLRSVQIDAGAHATTKDLFGLARSGDEGAFEAIVAAHHAELVRVAYVVCGDLELARDAAQRAWIKAWRNLAAVRQGDRLRPWLLAIAANEARQLVRAERRRPVRNIDALDIDPRASGPSAERIDLIAALGRLDADDRSLLALRFVAGVEPTEIARATGRSASGTRARLSRIVARLREDLGDD